MQPRSESIGPVLVVEDNPQNRKILKGLCARQGLEVALAENGREALDLLANGPFAVYIVDLMMPVMDGRTFIGHLKERYPDAVILVQTALDSAATIIDIMKLGVFDYVIKPIDIEVFQATLRKAVEFRRLKDLERDQLRRFRSELTRVREIQASSMSRSRTPVGFDIACSMLPAEDLSGDFYDGMPMKDDRSLIMLCDVTGHGIASSYVGAELKSMFRGAAGDASSPADIIRAINESITGQGASSHYMHTAMLCRIDDGGATVAIASAGHPPGIFYRAVDGTCQWVKGGGPVIGFTKTASYGERIIEMAAGDCLLLYTDGITEAFSENGGEMYGDERLRDVFSSHVKSSSREIVLAIIDDVYRFTNYAPQNDDITVVCVKKI